MHSEANETSARASVEKFPGGRQMEKDQKVPK